jgi:hypothetical protein
VNALDLRGRLLARILISLVFLLNALGIIDETVPAHEMIERGLPKVSFRLPQSAGVRYNSPLAWLSSSEYCLGLQLPLFSFFGCRPHSSPALFGLLPEHLLS